MKTLLEGIRCIVICDGAAGYAAPADGAALLLQGECAVSRLPS